MEPTEITELARQGARMGQQDEIPEQVLWMESLLLKEKGGVHRTGVYFPLLESLQAGVSRILLQEPTAAQWVIVIHLEGPYVYAVGLFQDLLGREGQ